MKDARSILIVEDEPLIAMMLEDFLDSLGHNGLVEVVGALELTHRPVLRRHERYAQVRERAVSGSRYCQRVGCPRLP